MSCKALCLRYLDFNLGKWKPIGSREVTLSNLSFRKFTVADVCLMNSDSEGVPGAKVEIIEPVRDYCVSNICLSFRRSEIFLEVEPTGYGVRSKNNE